MRVLVTGGSGFIGRHLVSALQRESGVTTLSLDYQKGAKFRDQSSVNQNILDYSGLEHVFDVFRPHLVYHLAAKLGVQDVLDQPAQTVSENVVGTLNVVKLCEFYGVRLIFASTSDVYGKSKDYPFREDGMLAIGPSVEPRWSYAISKLAGEHLTLAANGTCIRFFNVTGIGQKVDYVVPIMVQQALRGEDITVLGDGSSTRCFADVRDVVRALVKFIDLPQKDIGGEIYNIGNDHEITMYELAMRVREYVNPDAGIKYLPYPANYTEMPKRIPNLDKIRSLLDWRCEIPLEQIIQDLAAGMKKGEP